MALKDDVLADVRANPGSTIAEIAARLGRVKGVDLSNTLRRLQRDGVVVTAKEEGESGKREVRYSISS